MAALVIEVPNMKIRSLDDSATERSLLEMTEQKTVIIDFWTTRCERCPDALTKLNKFAHDYVSEKDVSFFSVCLGDNEEFARDLAEEGDWHNMNHFYTDDKEVAKAAWGFSAVPFLVIVKGNVTLASGPPSKVSTEVIRDLLVKTTPKESADCALGSDSSATSAVSVDGGLVSPSLVPEAFTTEEDF